MENESNDFKSTQALKDAFVKEVGCSWELVAKEIPQYTDITSLKKKYKVTRGKALPPDFKVLMECNCF